PGGASAGEREDRQEERDGSDQRTKRPGPDERGADADGRRPEALTRRSGDDASPQPAAAAGGAGRRSADERSRVGSVVGAGDPPARATGLPFRRGGVADPGDQPAVARPGGAGAPRRRRAGRTAA